MYRGVWKSQLVHTRSPLALNTEEVEEAEEAEEEEAEEAEEEEAAETAAASRPRPNLESHERAAQLRRFAERGGERVDEEGAQLGIRREVHRPGGAAGFVGCQRARSRKRLIRWRWRRGAVVVDNSHTLAVDGRANRVAESSARCAGSMARCIR